MKTFKMLLGAAIFCLATMTTTKADAFTFEELLLEVEVNHTFANGCRAEISTSGQFGKACTLFQTKVMHDYNTITAYQSLSSITYKTLTKSINVSDNWDESDWGALKFKMKSILQHVKYLAALK